MLPAQVEGLHFTYGGRDIAALAGIDLEVAPGEVLLLEGPSGGGKSTLLRALCGLVPHFHGGRMAGRVSVDGLDTRHSPPARLAERVGLVFQDPEAQAVMSVVVRDVAFGLEAAGTPPGEIVDRARDALESMGVRHLEGRRVATLSGGERQRVALAGVLARRPRLLLMDEPTSQLDDDGAAAVAEAIGRLRAHGGAVVLGEHRAERARPLATRIVAVRHGVLTPPEPAVETPRARAFAAGGQVRLAFEQLTAGHSHGAILQAAEGELRAGTITALCGPNGAGKTLLLRCLAGLHHPEGGRVWLDGREIGALPPERRFPRIALVGQEAGRHLITERVDDEIAYALRQLRVPAPERRRKVAEARRRFDLEPLASCHPLDLSVGQRERVALAAALVVAPAVVLLDEPTRGMDPGHAADLVDGLREMADRGAAVLITTHDRQLARAAADVTWMLDGAPPRRLRTVAPG